MAKKKPPPPEVKYEMTDWQYVALRHEADSLLKYPNNAELVKERARMIKSELDDIYKTKRVLQQTKLDFPANQRKKKEK